MNGPNERAAAARRAAREARGDSEALRREAVQARRRAGELVITAQRIAGHTTVLLLAGALDLASYDGVLDEVAARRGDEPAVHVDLSKVDFMDSTGLRLLLNLTDHAATDATELRLVRPSPAVRRVVEITRTAQRLQL